MHEQVIHLAAAVAAQRTVVASVLALLAGLVESFRHATDNEDLDAVTELTDALEAQTSTLAAAVSLNTPAEASVPADEAAPVAAETPAGEPVPAPVADPNGPGAPVE